MNVLSNASWMLRTCCVSGATALLGVGGMAASVYGANQYGAALFVFVPFGMGVACAVLRHLLRLRDSTYLTLLILSSVMLCAAILILVGFEGLVCLIMALPLALPAALGAGFLTEYGLTRNERTGYGCVVLVPLLLAQPGEVKLHPVESRLEIAAMPEAVWSKVVEFSPLREPVELIFRAGLAYPMRARIVGRGVGVVRYCEFSTGAFVEPIQVWNEPHLLQFSVRESPAPLREISPYSSLQPPHQHGYFLSRRGQFALTELANGHTLLSGTTWYEMRMGPGSYWQLWGDHIVHQIHMRVLQHIKTLAERDKWPKQQQTFE